MGYYNTLQNFFLKSNTHTCTLPIRLIESIENSPVKIIFQHIEKLFLDTECVLIKMFNDIFKSYPSEDQVFESLVVERIEEPIKIINEIN